MPAEVSDVTSRPDAAQRSGSAYWRLMNALRRRCGRLFDIRLDYLGAI